MIKLQDFAVQTGVTDRQVQRLLRKYESEVVGHFERRGPNGTWLDDQACEILRSKMKVKTVAVFDDALAEKIKELEEKLERKDVLIERLQQRELEKDNMIEGLKAEKLFLTEQAGKLEQLEKDMKETENKLHLSQQRENQLKEDLEKEKNRKLSFRERLTGKRRKE